jgi:15-cis-phytoene synthase
LIDRIDRIFHVTDRLPAELPAELNGPDRLAIMHASSEVRGYLTSLLVLDRRLAAVVRKTSEPIIAQMRFAWWRDRLADDAGKWPKGEPFFAGLRQMGDQPQVRAIADKLTQLVDIWEELAVADASHHDVTAAFHAARAQLIFEGLADACGAADPTKVIQRAGRNWSAFDLACQLPDRATADSALLAANERLPRQLRALTILHRSAILEWQNRSGQGRGAVYSSLRLFLSAMTGR